MISAASQAGRPGRVGRQRGERGRLPLVVQQAGRDGRRRESRGGPETQARQRGPAHDRPAQDQQRQARRRAEQQESEQQVERRLRRRQRPGDRLAGRERVERKGVEEPHDRPVGEAPEDQGVVAARLVAHEGREQHAEDGGEGEVHHQPDAQRLTGGDDERHRRHHSELQHGEGQHHAAHQPGHRAGQQPCAEAIGADHGSDAPGDPCKIRKGRVRDSPDAKRPARRQIRPDWIPASAGMTEGLRNALSWSDRLGSGTGIRASVTSARH